MPRVGNKTFPETPEGIAAARAYAFKTGRMMKVDNGSVAPTRAKRLKKTPEPVAPAPEPVTPPETSQVQQLPQSFPQSGGNTTTIIINK